MKNPISGIVPPIVTPLRGRDELDVEGVERLIEHLLRGGVHGLFILGTTGEGPGLAYKLRREFVERVCRQVGKRVPILVAITDTAYVESVRLAQHAASCGADAVVLAPPYYLPEGQPELREYLAHILADLPLPLFLYNMPALTKVSFEAETLEWAVGQGGIVGLKDSSGDVSYFRRALEIARPRKDWSLLIGQEMLVGEAMAMGGHGGVTGGANVFPRLYVALFEAARRGGSAEVERLQGLVGKVGQGLYTVGKHPSAIIKGIKCALSVQGICDDFMTEPFHRFRSPEREIIEQRVRELQQVLSEAGF